MESFVHDLKSHFVQLRERLRLSFDHGLKTSTQISLKFTLFTMLQVMLFSVLANAIFFQNRYTRQRGAIPPMNRSVAEKFVLGKNRMPEPETFSTESQEGQALLQYRRRKNIAKIEDTYFMYRQVGNQFFVSNVTPQMTVQKNLIRISIYLMLIFGGLAYISSRFFVKSSLKKLNHLLSFLNQLNIDNLNEKLSIEGHPDDEINRVTEKFNEALEKIHRQTLSLKDFVTNASHEMKTPLMSMNTEIDYAMKTKGYEQGLSNVKEQLKDLNSLLETLVTISSLEAVEQLKKESGDISELTKSVITDLEKIYQQKGITITAHVGKNILKKIHHNSYIIIVKNILDNAYKFTPEGGKLDVSLDDHHLIIKDSGKGIAADDLEHIRERFRQADRSKTDTKSFGLGLYLVKLLVEKHGRNIAITSKVNKGTTCTITF